MTRREVLKSYAKTGSCPVDLDCTDCPYRQKCDKLELEKKAKCAEKEYIGVDVSNTVDIPGKTRIIWHDLRKYPEDLPEKGLWVLTVRNGVQLLAYLREDSVWTTDGHNAFENVTAWCRIPRYEVK